MLRATGAAGETVEQQQAANSSLTCHVLLKRTEESGRRVRGTVGGCGGGEAGCALKKKKKKQILKHIPHYSSTYSCRLWFYELLTSFPGVAIISVVYFRSVCFFFALPPTMISPGLWLHSASHSQSLGPLSRPDFDPELFRGLTDVPARLIS